MKIDLNEEEKNCEFYYAPISSYMRMQRIRSTKQIHFKNTHYLYVKALILRRREKL